MKKIICVFALIVMLACFGSCGSLYDGDYVYDGVSLIGKWCEKDYEDKYYFSYEFFENGKVEWTEYYYGIKFSTVLGDYTVDGNEITTKVTNYDGTVETVKQKFSITDKRELVIIYLSSNDQMTEEEMVLVPFDIDFNEDNSFLVGSWEDTDNPGEVWTFNSDYSGKIENSEYGYKMYYSVKGKKLYMAYEFVDGVRQGLVEFNYTVKGNTLTIKGEINDEKLEYVFEKRN